MLKGKLYSFESIFKVDFALDLCEQKEEFLEILKSSTPVNVDKFDSNGTEWDFNDEYLIADSYWFCVNKGTIFISPNTDSIFGLLDFLINLAYYDDRNLILSFDDEGKSSAITVLSLGNNEIRFSVYDYGLMNYKKILSDIIINKRTFIVQFYNILNNIYKDIPKCKGREHVINRLKNCIDVLSQYISNENEFKKTYNISKFVRIFDISYKDLNGIWQFVICFEDDERSNPEYWEKQKQEGKILDYDYIEQDSEHGTKAEILKYKKPDTYTRAEYKNWVYLPKTQNWYSTNEIMPEPTRNCCGIYQDLTYTIKFDSKYYENEDIQLKNYVEESYDTAGNLRKDEELGYLDCTITFKNNDTEICKFNLDYRYNRQIRNAIKKAKNGEYVRFNLGSLKYDKMHIWKHTYSNTNKSDISVACYECTETGYQDIENFYFVAEKEFLDCFISALDEVEYKIKLTKSIMESGENLKIDKKFLTDKNWNSKIEYLENFVGEYACVYKSNLDGWGIINKNFEWIIKPENVTIFGEEHPKWGKKIEGWFTKYTYLHNIDGKLFIAAKHDNKQFVMDIKGNIQIPHVSDNIYYTYLNDELWFVAVDYNKSYIVNSKGEDVLSIDFPVGERFWILNDILIVSKDEKFGIIDWKGKIKLDFIFSDIKVNPDNLDFIAVKYMDKWGFINKSGKIGSMKIKKNSVRF